MKTILIVGCGDIAKRMLPMLVHRYRVLALVRDRGRCALLRALGATPVLADMDSRASLARIAGLADIVLHFTPPPGDSVGDPRTRNLLAALSQGKLPAQLIYISTSGVYGDCGGEWVSETHPLNPQTTRAQRRVDAEQQLRAWGRRNSVRVSILRVPGIYAADRLPLERLRAATPSIVREEDGYTNHIHADDLARTVLAALRHGKPNRVYHACDDQPMKTGDYFDAVADAHGLPRPPRLPREEVERAVSPTLWSFMNESRRLANERLKKELKVRLRYSVVREGLKDREGG